MNLHSPFFISSRLLPALKVGNATIQLERDGTTNDNRDRFKYTIDLPDGSTYSDNELRSGCQGSSLQEAFVTLLGFLGAAGESYRYAGEKGENADLFPLPVVEFAHQYSDEIAMLEMEIGESEEELIEE